MEVSMTLAKVAIEPLPCDGCGQPASSEHIAGRLRRLELTTRFRPIHLQAVFLGAQSPVRDADFLYGAEDGFSGEGAELLQALNIEWLGRAAGEVLAEFQRRGFLLTHVLECAGSNGSSVDALKKRLPSVLKRLRTSWKPKRLVVFSKEMKPLIAELKLNEIGCKFTLDGDEPFDFGHSASVGRLHSAL